MLAVLKTPEETGYNKCISCGSLGVICDGPNLTAVSSDRFCEWCRLRKEYLGWTNAHLVEVAGVSKATVDRIMAGTATGLNGETKSRIVCALIHQKSSDGEAWGKYPCPKGAENIEAHKDMSQALEAAELRYSELKANDQAQIDHLKNENEFYKAQLVNKDRMLDDRAEYLRKKDKTIMALFGLVFLLTFIVAVFLIIDFTNSDLGFFW